MITHCHKIHAISKHTYGQREIYDFIDDAKRMIRPANFPSEAPGVGMR
jgi:calcineurin-like phosphoesterase